MVTDRVSQTIILFIFILYVYVVSFKLSYRARISGLFRVYPGTILGLEDKQKADFFDARRRVWYLQAISSPKDVVIMIDVSGSMVGSNIGTKFSFFFCQMNYFVYDMII